jgi:ribosomal protein S6
MIDIPRDDQTRLYELTYLLPASLTESELTAARESIEKLVAKYTGEVVMKENWGKRELAYKIRHGAQRQTEAVYTMLVVEFLPKKAYEFEKELYLQDMVMRHLFVLSEAESKDKAEASPNAQQE